MIKIKVGKTYDYFDDGKISETRRIPVTITGIIPFDKIDAKTLLIWAEEVIECNWLYAKETDYFIKGNLMDEDLKADNQDSVIFVRTIDKGWFSLGWWAGRLDHNGKLLKILNKRNEQ